MKTSRLAAILYPVLCIGILTSAWASPRRAPQKPLAVKAGLEEVWSLGGLNDNKLLMWVGLAVDEAGRLFVSDALDYALKVFDAEGRLLRRTGREDAGPDGFQALRELAISRESVFVTDQFQPRILVFSKELRYRSSIPQPRPMSCLRALPDGTLAASCAPFKSGEKPVIWMADSRGRTIAEIGYGSDSAQPAADRASFVLSGQDIVLAYNFKDKVERLDRSGRVLWSKTLFHRPAARFKSVMGTKLPTQYIYKDIAQDRAGRIYLLGGGFAEHPSRDVFVLDSRGEMIATLLLPEPTHALHIDGQDFLYSRADDGLAIQKFRVVFPPLPERKAADRPRP